MEILSKNKIIFISQKVLGCVRVFVGAWVKYICIPQNLINVVCSFAFLYIAYQTTIFAAELATMRAGAAPLSDIILSNIPRVDTSYIHGPVSFFLYDMRWVFFLIFIQSAPFATKALGTLIFLRAATINMTNIGMPEFIVPTIAAATFGGDLFFSGHVANTLMLGLCFWHIKLLRLFFLGISILFGVSALLGHYHYTIDVVAAPFFAYGVYTLCRKIFKEDYQQSVSSQRNIISQDATLR